MTFTCGLLTRSFVFSKPPIVVFMLCLLAFAMTTLSLSFYVSQTDKITNPDVLCWNSLLIRISKLNFCLEPFSNQTISQNSSAEMDTEVVSISVPISPKFIEDFRQRTIGKMSSDLVFAKGEIRMSQLGRHLSRYEDHKIAVTFEIAKETQDDVCMYVQGPKLLISDLNSGNSPQNCSKSFNRNATTLVMKSHSYDEPVPLDWCDAIGRNETPMVLDFSEQPDWSVYVSARDKEMMQIHLLVTSVFIFVVLVTIIVGVLIRTTAGLCRGGTHLYSATSTVENHYLAESSGLTSPNVERG